MVESQYFAVMQIPLLQGRVFDDQDTERGEPVTLINERLAHQLWPGDIRSASTYGQNPAMVLTAGIGSSASWQIRNTAASAQKPAQ